jgi:hypothetical protein
LIDFCCIKVVASITVSVANCISGSLFLLALHLTRQLFLVAKPRTMDAAAEVGEWKTLIPAYLLKDVALVMCCFPSQNIVSDFWMTFSRSLSHRSFVKS